MPLHIGTSGWQYRDWRERFYPPGLAQREWLPFYAQRFATVESNAAFYRLPDRSTFQAWAERTPDDMVWTVKVSRYLTHVKRLAEPQEPVERFVDRVRGLGDKLGAVLLQLPPTLRADHGRLRATLERFPAGMRVAVEFRHPSWSSDATRDLLAERDAAWCLADRRRPLDPEWRTAGWGYVRFHAGRAMPEPCYGRQALATWVERIHRLWPDDEDVYVLFNNDPRGCALRDAATFHRLAARAGSRTTRVALRPRVSPAR